MRKLISSLIFLAFISIGFAQKDPIQLKEATIDYRAVSMQVDPLSNSVTLLIPEEYLGQFQQDPRGFINNNFNAQQFLQENDDLDFDTVSVNCKTSKGFFEVNYDARGQEAFSYQKFNDVALPLSAMKEIKSKFPGYVVERTVHIASSTKGIPRDEYYKVKISNGKSTSKLRFDKTAAGISLTKW